MDLSAWRIKVVLILIVVMQIFVFYAFDMVFHPKKVQDYQDSWIKAKGGVGNLDKNPIYSKFQIMRPAIRKKTNLLIIVSSAPKRGDRRSAIRETWWKDCTSSDQVQQMICKSFRVLKPQIVIDLFFSIPNQIWYSYFHGEPKKIQWGGGGGGHLLRCLVLYLH